ncbi:MAG: hypothetical protein ACI9C1_001541 [Candidatus Aldehydirespiratoraceae bacterium]|jgi:hypothetical protein
MARALLCEEFVGVADGIGLVDDVLSERVRSGWVGGAAEEHGAAGRSCESTPVVDHRGDGRSLDPEVVESEPDIQRGDRASRAAGEHGLPLLDAGPCVQKFNVFTESSMAAIPARV